MYTICDRCKGDLEKPKVLKGHKGNICQKCQKDRERERVRRLRLLEKQEKLIAQNK